MKSLFSKIKGAFTLKSKLSANESLVDKCRRENRDLCESLGIVGEFNPTTEDSKIYDGLSQAILSDKVEWVKTKNGRINVQNKGYTYGTNNTARFKLNNINYEVVESSHYFGAYLLGYSYNLYSEGDSVFSSKIVDTTLGGKLFCLMEDKQKDIDEEIKLKIQQQEVVAKQRQEAMALKVLNSLND